MKFLPLVWAMLWRSRTRTVLTFLSITVAFVLFALLRTLESGFFQGVRIAGDDRLVTTYRQGITNILPYAHRAQIEQVPGVRAVQATFPFGGTWRNPQEQVGGVALDLDDRIVLDPRVLVNASEVEALRRTRTGVLVGADLARQFGWKAGDHIALTIPQHRKDGGQTWEFDIVGTWQYDPAVVEVDAVANALVMRYDYWNESVAYPNLVLWYTVTIADPAQAAAVGRAIDALFLNSQFATKTKLEREFQADFLRQIGDIGAVLRAVLIAVFFTLILVAGNAMMQAFRERIPELGVLKTLGFTDATLAALMAAEAAVLCVGAGAAGLGLAALAVEPLQQAFKGGIQLPSLESVTIQAGLALALGLALFATLIPAWRCARLTVVDALAAQA